MPSDPSEPAWPSRRRQAVSGCLLSAGQVFIVTGCFAIMGVSLETNGTMFTAGLEHTRFQVWILCSGPAMLTVGTVLASLLGMHALGGGRTVFIWIQVIVVLAVLTVVIRFAYAIPVPPGIRSAPLFTGY